MQAVERIAEMEDASDLENKVAMEGLSDKEREAVEATQDAYAERKDEIEDLAFKAETAGIGSAEAGVALDKAKELLAEVERATEKACE